VTIKITKISPQKNSDRVSLYSGDEFIIGIDKDLLVDYHLGVDKELDQTLLQKLKKDDDLKKCLNKAYRYLSYRPRSEQEMSRKLQEKFEPKTVTLAIKKLKKFRYIDDTAFINFWLEGRGKTRGPALLKAELLRKGVSRESIETAFTKTVETLTEEALDLIQSKRKYHNLPVDELYEKIGPYLGRRGYDYEVIKEVIKKLKEDQAIKKTP
jgi:regulatory protein